MVNCVALNEISIQNRRYEGFRPSWGYATRVRLARLCRLQRIPLKIWISYGKYRFHTETVLGCCEKQDVFLMGPWTLAQDEDGRGHETVDAAIKRL
jgi:hypothetical protein